MEMEYNIPNPALILGDTHINTRFHISIYHVIITWDECYTQGGKCLSEQNMKCNTYFSNPGGMIIIIVCVT